MTEFTCDLYSISIPDDDVVEVLSYIENDSIRERVTEAYTERALDVPVWLPVQHCDTLLDAMSRMEVSKDN